MRMHRVWPWIAALLAAVPALAQTEGNGSMLVYIGTYTNEGSKGIYVWRYDPETGELSDTGQMAETKNPTYLAIHPNKRYLYAVSEIADFQGEKTGGVVAYAIDPETGGLSKLNEQASKGAGPCYVSVDADGKYVFVANYTSGSVAMLPIHADGSLGEASDWVQHEGSSVDPRRQKGPHGHCFQPGPENKYAFACDLGLDKVLIYRIDAANGKIPPADPAFAEVPAGDGPRHITFHPNGRFAYVINEIGNTMSAFSYDAERGRLDPIETISTLPDDFDDTSWCADVHVHPNGRFLYGSNRGHDSLAVYAIDEVTGKLTLVEYEPTLGGHPRNFVIDPAGRYLLVANRDGDNIVTFAIDPETGALEPTGAQATVSMPVCVKFLEP